MSQHRRKIIKPQKDQKPVPPNEECESNVGQEHKGKRKPACPEGYPDEQPNEKQDGKK